MQKTPTPTFPSFLPQISAMLTTPPPFFLPLLLLPLAAVVASPATYPLPPDAVSLLSFKSKADSDNHLFYTLTERFDYCQWRGVKCAQGRVVLFVAAGFGLRGAFAPATLSRLDQLRVLSLHNNSLSGPVPDLSPLVNLKSLFLGRNSFSGTFPPSILFLHRLVVLDLSYNNLTGAIPVQLSALDRLTSLRLERNRFNGTLPPLNQSFLAFFNVSGNNLAGPIPSTPTLSKFDTSSFSLNPDLCGEIVNKACSSLRSPFFDSPAISNNTSSSAPLSQSVQAQGDGMILTPPLPRKHKRTAAIFGFAFGISMLILSIVCVSVVLFKKQRKQTYLEDKQPVAAAGASTPANSVYTNSTNQVHDVRDYSEAVVTAKSREIETQPVRRAGKSGALVFCGGDIQMYTLEQLMRASAELLGRGTIGTTYKAILDNQLILTVKRIDAIKTAMTSTDSFDWHMEAVGGLSHPNLVPVLAYFQAKGERLVIYDYQPNGSLFNLIHGSRSTRAKPLHWTSCLKIAEDVADGLAYIHQVPNLVHGNLKSSNVLLGADFEARMTDYCLAILAHTGSTEDDPDSAACRAPETRNSSRRATSKSDVYAYGVLLLELLSGKRPSQHPYMAPTDILDWVRAVREYDGADDNQLEMLTEVASVCSLTSPEQRPAMWQVLKMIHEIKESVTVVDNTTPGYS